MQPITIADITTSDVNGTGAFDVMMRTITAHLDTQFRNGRITGEMYSTVYLGALTAVLQQATQFALTKDQTANQAALIEAQIAKTQEDQLLTAQQRANMVIEGANLVLQGERLTAEKLLVEAQIAKMNNDTGLVNQQILNMQAEALNIPKIGAKLDMEVSLTEAQVLKVAADTDLTDEQKLNVVVERSNLGYQGSQIQAQTALIDQQASKVTADVALSTQQKTNLAAEALNIPKQGLLIDAQRSKTDADKVLVDKNVLIAIVEEAIRQKNLLKTDAEIAVLEQRVKTERAQIEDVIDGVTVTGQVGVQKTLQTAQANGFTRDAEYKVAKLAADIWATQRTTDEGISPAGAGLADAELKKMVDKAKAGVGII